MSLRRAQTANTGAVGRLGTLKDRNCPFDKAIGLVVSAIGLPELKLAILVTMHDGEEFLQPSAFGQTYVERIYDDLEVHISTAILRV